VQLLSRIQVPKLFLCSSASLKRISLLELASIVTQKVKLPSRSALFPGSCGYSVRSGGRIDRHMGGSPRFIGFLSRRA
jgi:hypothetical protein